MRTKLLIFEYLLAMSFALQILLPQIFTWTVSLTAFLTILILKYKYEGLRITLFIYIAIQASLLLFSHSMINITLTLITYLTLSYFPVYDFPDTKGPFLVGFKDLFLKQNLEVSVFYPTFQQTKRVQYKTLEDGWVRIYDIMRSYPGHFIPKFVYRVLFSFLDFLDIGANLNAQIISPEQLCNGSKFPAIIFSHGLSANRNLYTGFARQWASYGYIVFCIDHDEPIYMKFTNWEQMKKIKAVHLDERCKVISTVADFIHNSTEVKEFFQNSAVEIDYTKLSLAGHSFGSAAVVQGSAVDNRITGALILLDPWLYPISDQVLETAAKKPVLVLRSQSFETVFEEFQVKAKIQKYVEANKEYQDQTLSCYFKNATHNSFCDLIVHMPREMKLIGVIEDTKEVENMYNGQTMLSQIFLDLMLYSPNMYDIASKKTMVTKAFDGYLAKAGEKSKLEIDCF